MTNYFEQQIKRVLRIKMLISAGISVFLIVILAFFLFHPTLKSETYKIGQNFLYDILILIILIIVMKIIFQLRIYFNYRNHKLYKQIRKMKDSEFAVELFNREASSDKAILVGKKLIITPTYVFCVESNCLERTSELMWAHISKTTSSFNFIPIYYKHTLNLLFLNKRPFYSIDLYLNEVEYVMSELIAKYPDVISGFSQDLQNIYEPFFHVKASNEQFAALWNEYKKSKKL